jgi:hypothetical protein
VLADRLADDPGNEALDHRPDAGRAEALVELAPADHALVGRQLDEVVVAPAGIAGERLDGPDFHVRPPVVVTQPSMALARGRRLLGLDTAGDN